MTLEWIDAGLAALRRDGLLRSRRPPLERPGPFVTDAEGRSLLNLCSNDYLSLAGHAGRYDAASGAGSSRLVAGDFREHASLERNLSEWLVVEASLAFTSGYAANVGTIAALVGEGALVVSDARNHASIVDGCRLSRARIVVVPHLDFQAVARTLASAPERRRLVVTDAYFSMDGTLAPVAELRRICDQHAAALYVDEAHALGVWGPTGRGVCAQAGVRADVTMGTLGKAFGASGAFVAGSAKLIEWLWNRARSFVFSTGVSPASALAAREALPAIAAGERTARLHTNASLLRQELAVAGVVVAAGSSGPILPVLLPSPDAALAVSAALLRRGIFIHPIRPPTVAPGTSRLRITVQADHEPGALVRAALEIAAALR